MIRKLSLWLNWWLRARAWPTFDCEDCIGMLTPHGCYCSASDAVAPGEGPSEHHLWLRWLHGWLFQDQSPYWRDLDDVR